MNVSSVSYDDPVDWIQSEFSWRRLKNPKYSLRSFARFLGISSGRLSELLAGKRSITEELGERFSDKLGYKGTERKEFLRAIEKVRNKKGKCKKAGEYNCLSEDAFKEICDWYYLAILNVLKIDDCTNNPKNIAKRLGLNVSTAKGALRKLQKLELIKMDGQGQYVRTSKPITTSKDIPSAAIRRFQGQIIEKAQQALIEVPAEHRDFSTSFVNVNSRSLKKIKKAIESSRRSLSSSCKTSNKTELYALNIQFFPLTTESIHD